MFILKVLNFLNKHKIFNCDCQPIKHILVYRRWHYFFSQIEVFNEATCLDGDLFNAIPSLINNKY